MKLLFIADIVGEVGRKILKELLPQIKKEEQIDFTIVNAENSAGGFGITPRVAEEIFFMGVDVITLGNHTWDRKEVFEIIGHPRILRPANYPPNVPGKGFNVYVPSFKGVKIGVISLMGRVFMANIDCPFRKSDAIIEEIKAQTPIVFVDFHAEATSEKLCFGLYLDGKVSAVIGTHTHVATADEKILPQGTAYLTDVGMTGPSDSVIGVKKEIILKRYLTSLPIRFEVAREGPIFEGVVIEINEKTGKALSIKRISKKEKSSS
ncbi:TIGR00282 family metallophosphoesterase [bacterium]|nr:TIGR00282 family metallophosphoesterase [bacterium]